MDGTAAVSTEDAPAPPNPVHRYHALSQLRDPAALLADGRLHGVPTALSRPDRHEALEQAAANGHDLRGP